ncbi:MAG: peptidyl-prolyl cis-trans isomerase, partial [Candidatus Riflebacteria bacterium]
MHLKKQRLSALFIFTIILGMIVSSLAAAETAVPSTGSPDDVLAEIGDKKITRAEFEKELNQFQSTANPQAAAHFASAEGRAMFLNQICEIYALDAKAQKMGLNSGPEFEKNLHEIAVSRLAQEKMQQSISSVKVGEDEAKKHYEANKTNYTEPPAWHLYQIAVADGEKAAELKKELDAGKSFLEIAKKESTDDYKEAGGDQGFVPESAISPMVLEILKQLKQDQVSGPIKADEKNYLLVKYTEKKDGGLKSYDSVSAQLMRELESNKQREVYEGEIEKLKKDLSYKLNQDSLELVKKETLTDEEKEKVLFSFAGKEIKVS